MPSHISGPFCCNKERLYVPRGCHIGQCRYRAFLLSQKVVPDSSGKENCYQVREG